MSLDFLTDLNAFEEVMTTLERLLAKRRWKNEDEMVAYIRAMLRVRAAQN